MGENNFNIIIIAISISFIIGLIVGICTSKKINKKIVEYLKVRSIDLYNNIGFMKSIFLITSLLIFLSTLILPIFGVNNNSDVLLSFMSSFWISWILTEYSAAQELVAKQRDLSIIYFRNSRSLTNKIDSRIICIEDALDDRLNESGNQCNSCNKNMYIEEIKGHLDGFKSDVIQIQNNSSDAIAEDILNYYRLDDIESELRELEYEIDDEEIESKSKEKIEKKITELKDSRKNILNNLDPRIKLLFDEEKRYNDQKRFREIEKSRNSKEIPEIKDNRILKRDEFERTKSQQKSKTK